MLVVIVPLVLLFAIALIKKIPWIGGDIRAALLAAAVSAGIIGGLAPMGWVNALVDGVDRLAWVIALSLFGSIYAEAQVRLGAMETTLFGLRALFGKSPRGLIAAVFVTLILAGSLLGDAIAAATVIGFLVIHALSELRIKPVQIGMMILLGASIGSIMPPISQGVFLSASLVGVDPTPVTNIAYLTVGGGALFAILESFRFVRAKRGIGAKLAPAEQTVGGASSMGPGHRATAGPEGVAPVGSSGSGLGSLDATGPKAFMRLMAERWKTLIPLAVLIVIVVAKSGFGFDVFTEIPPLAASTSWLAGIPILKGIAFPVVMAIIVAILVSFLFKSVRCDTLGTVTTGLSKVSGTVQIQLCAAAMIGIFYAVGAVDMVAAAAESLAGPELKLGGAAGIVAVGMLTGSQTAAQTVLVTFLGPILVGLGVDPVNAALGASHIAAAGQNMPPVGLTAFVVCGLVGSALNTKVDPVKVMILALPNSIYFLLVGLLVWFI
jgi:TRAP-type transport system large permease protein